jgi:hydroxyacylglutathione hydrolase
MAQPDALEVEALPALRDNYIWALTLGELAAVVDPGEPEPVERWLGQNNCRLAAILVTHHHPDHTDGVAALKARHGARVYGPAREPIPAMDDSLHNGDRVTPLAGGPEFRVLDVAGHTRGHIAYYGEKMLFCGDTLFSAGCGRIFEGTARQLFDALARLAALPDETAVYAGHEYTVANLSFAREVLPDDVQLEKTLANALETRNNGKVTLPSNMAREREINVFLRTGDRAVQAAAERKSGKAISSALETFTELRRWKDHFRGD